MTCWLLYLFNIMVMFFFFKQKTAYEMRISDWSSDVCSSDLHVGFPATIGAQKGPVDGDNAGVFFDRHDQRRRERLRGTRPALAAGIEARVDAVGDDGSSLAQIAIRERAGEGFGVAPDCERKLVEVAFAVLSEIGRAHV